MKRISWLILGLFSVCGCTNMAQTVNRPVQSFRNSFENHTPSLLERHGKVYYLDGAGNLGYGQDTVPKALLSAGFRGDIEIVIWTSYTGPIGDQMIRINARLRSEQLTRRIVEYRNRFPDSPVYIIGLSAGTGVAVWAVENLPSDVKVDAMVLLGSSLSNNYDMTQCLRQVNDKVFVLHSPHDAILRNFIPFTGTIDGMYFVEPAGRVGLSPPSGIRRDDLELYRQKVVNIPWRPQFERLGYTGGHTEATSYQFVRYFIAPRLLGVSTQPTHVRPAPEADVDESELEEEPDSLNAAAS